VLNTDVNIGSQNGTGGPGVGNALANIEPAAGGDDGEHHAKKNGKGQVASGSKGKKPANLADVEPAAGGNAGAGTGGKTTGGDVACANSFLENKPCAQ
jgi:hypothetical protein